MTLVKIARKKVDAPLFTGFLMLGAGLLTLAGSFGKYSMLCDILCNFRVHYAIILILTLIAALIMKKWRLFWVGALFTIINLSQIVPLYFPGSHLNNKLTKETGRLTVLQTNVHTANREYGKIIQYISEIKPDIIAIEEVNDQWVSELKRLDKDYPFHKVYPRNDNFGIGLYSRIPVKSIRIRSFGVEGLPSIVAKIDIGGQPLTVLVTHPLPPIDKNYFFSRNNQIAAIASAKKDFDPNLIILGDLNTTPWSYYFKHFVSKMNLRDARRGFGVKTSWPVQKPLLRIPIDYCLTSKNIITRNMGIGPDIGSDHFPLYAELSLTSQ